MVDELVHAGHYGSATEIVDEGLRLVQQREAKLAALRADIEASIARGGSYTSDEVRAHVRARLDAWEQEQANNSVPA
ncbi:MAG: antitoxin ParD1/3/4 [Sphingomonadales bacterium]|nr:antitoxin ParD1/3/4 [Sphingomonadales bacterium]